jgi:uncharacterized protein
MQFEHAKLYAINRLTEELSPGLYYHSLRHTRDDVVPAVEVFAADQDVTGDELTLLMTAAWFHDLGFVKQRVGHEAAGAQIAAEVLPDLGYGPKQVERVQGIIMATLVPQQPRNLLEQIMADADLDVLGREDFLECNGNLRRELAYFGDGFSDAAWYSGQLNFVSSHVYFTPAAQKIRNERKAVNVADLQALLNAAEG